MNLYTMYDEYESAEFARRKPMSARAKQAISRALKGRKRRRGMSLTGRTALGKGVRALGATAALGGAGLLARRAMIARNQPAVSSPSKLGTSGPYDSSSSGGRRRQRSSASSPAPYQPSNPWRPGTGSSVPTPSRSFDPTSTGRRRTRGTGSSVPTPSRSFDPTSTGRRRTRGNVSSAPVIGAETGRRRKRGSR